MSIVDYGFFTSAVGSGGIVAFTNQEGRDWYELRRTLTEWTPENGNFVTAIYPTWALVDDHGVITNVEFDPSRLMPGDRRILGIDAPIETVSPGMVYRGGKIESAPPQQEETRSASPEDRIAELEARLAALETKK